MNDATGQRVTLFDRPLSHTGDPITSYEAADEMVKSGKLNKQEQEVWKEINRGIDNMETCLGLQHQNFTAKELASWSGIDYFVIQRRLSGLHNKGKIERIKTGKERIGATDLFKSIYKKRDGCCVWRIL